MTSETSSAREIGKGINNGKNKVGKIESLRLTITRENEKLTKTTLQQNIDWFTII
jgi:hypothetical protein